MRTLFLLNPTAGKADCTRTLPQQINVAAARAGLAPEEYAIQVTNHAGHARELANAAAQQAAATIFCAPLVQRKSFWIWMPSWPVGR